MQLKEFDFFIPKELIATKPVYPRDSCRLLVGKPQNTSTGNISIEDTVFSNISQFLNPGDVLLLNNTKVIKSFLILSRGVTLNLHTQVSDKIWRAFCKKRKKVQVGMRLEVHRNSSEMHDSLGSSNSIQESQKAGVKFLRFLDTGEVEVELQTNMTSLEFLDTYGHIPLPQYIIKARDMPSQDLETSPTKLDEGNGQTSDFDIQAQGNSYKHNSRCNIYADDDTDYQTIYGEIAGSIAAPTAGLHFTQDLLDQLQNKGIIIKYITLHVGIGTYKPIKTEDIRNHEMHAEYVQFPSEVFAELQHAKKHGGKIYAIGSTSLRALEGFMQLNNIASLDLETDSSQANSNNGTTISSCTDVKNKNIPHKWITEFETNIYITPGYNFRGADALITNFHLPKSSLIVLVASFIGLSEMRQLYTHAIQNQYKFYSYGDASLLYRNKK